MNESQILIGLILIALSIIIPVGYIYKKKLEQKKTNDKLKESRYVTEKEKIRVYLNNINEATRSKHR
tara:strand:+ start:536 stop:736 length:201 start_codon:yes stop_codon:yes gene_type:complete